MDKPRILIFRLGIRSDFSFKSGVFVFIEAKNNIIKLKKNSFLRFDLNFLSLLSLRVSDFSAPF